ncbi:MAG: thioredoxin-dependent thiol peroxidase [Candidatus Omnitrophica bacterium]|nr:thioredoxin-dependent thiol peroxidase [Candidatus Omnitrophota bacterium]
MNKPQVGSIAPNFALVASNGRQVSLEHYYGRKNVVLYFYPKDDTEGCIKEACGFREVMDDLFESDTVVLGISPDNLHSHQRFVAKYYLPFLLLCDSETNVSRQYGIWGEKLVYGKKTMGICRTTFIVNKEGKIAKIFEKVKPAEHAKEVLSYIKTLNRLTVAV